MKQTHPFSVALSCLAIASVQALAEANYVYHERTGADPGCGGQYVTRLNPTSAETYPLQFKVEYQFFTDSARVYYTTNGSAPSGAFGTPSGATFVVSGSYGCTFGSPLVDVVSATIPAMPEGTVVKYIVSAWHSGGGSEIFANGPGSPCGCGTPTSSASLATVFQYTVGSTTNLYWDSNGATGGAGTTPAGTWGSSTFWSTVLDGTAATAGWTSGRNAIFSAGNDATGAYTITLSGTQTAGNLTVEEGTLSLVGGTASIGAGNVTINSGAILNTTNNGAIASTAGSTMTVNGGTVQTSNPGSAGTFIDTDFIVTLTAAGGTFSHTVSNVLNIVQDGSAPATVRVTGPGGLTKAGVGVLAVAAAMDYQGPTIVNDGELRMRTTANRVPTNTALTVNSPGIFNLNGISTTIGSLAGNGKVGFGASILTIGGSANSTFSGSMSNIANAGASGVTTGAGRIIKRGSGALTLTGTNGITGSITNLAGSIIVATNATLCDPSLDLFIGGGSLNMSNAAQTVLSLAGTNGTLELGPGHTFTVTATTSKSFTGAIAGPGSFTKLNSGNLTLGGANTFDGNLTISGGKVLPKSDNAFGSTSGYTEVASGAEVLFDATTNTCAEPFRLAGVGGDGGAITVQNSALVTLSGPITLIADTTNTVSSSATVFYTNPNAITSLANQNLTLQGGSGAGGGGSISGTISLGTGSLTKLQSGKWVLSGSNSYSGGTFINAGTIQAANTTGSATGSGTVTVAIGATLSGTGIINGPVVVNGTFAPGASIGTLTINNTLNLASNTVVEIDKSAGQTSDQVAGVTTLTFGGKLTLVTNGPVLAAGDSFPIFSANTYTGSFTSIAPTTPGPDLAWDTVALTNSGTLTVHANPVANVDDASAQHGQTITIPVVKPLANDTGEPGETLSVVGVGANASLGGGLITYTAPASGSSDTITYTLSDGRGGTSAGTINVSLSGNGGSYNQLSATVLLGGDLELTYLGIPGTNYALDISHDLTPPVSWTALKTNPAAANGYLIFTNTPSMSPTNDFYRTRYVP